MNIQSFRGCLEGPVSLPSPPPMDIPVTPDWTGYVSQKFHFPCADASQKAASK